MHPKDVCHETNEEILGKHESEVDTGSNRWELAVLLLSLVA